MKRARTVTALECVLIRRGKLAKLGGLAAVCLWICLSSSTASGEFFTGVDTLGFLGFSDYHSFDFSRGTHCGLDSADVTFVLIIGNCLGYLFDTQVSPNGNSNGGIFFTPEDLSTAPEAGYDPAAEAGAGDGFLVGFYYVITREAHYAKFAVLEATGVVIRWLYQSDGSRNLDYESSIEGTSWGRIKRLFRE